MGDRPQDLSSHPPSGAPKLPAAFTLATPRHQTAYGVVEAGTRAPVREVSTPNWASTRGNLNIQSGVFVQVPYVHSDAQVASD